jgi:3-hydroxybutyryl-CoA dehydrogenase
VSPDLPDTIGVIGAGTMGAGIAQLAAQTGARTLLHDPVPEALERGIAGIGKALDRLVERGKMSAEDAAGLKGRIEPAGELADLAPCGLVIEAAPERLELKLDLFGRLAEIVAADAVLATNTSSLSVTEIAAGIGSAHPERVVGLHFFNPAPMMKLVEVVAGQASSPAAIAVAQAVGEAMGKRVIDAADIAGFLVNRVNRPFSLEALRLLAERVATAEQIDRIVRLGGGFRMGPFELMDLIGIDINYAVAESLYRSSFGEPRYRPSPIQARMVAAGRLGRKTAGGWYDYAEGREHRPADPEPPAGGGGDGRVVFVTGELPIAYELARAAGEAGFAVVRRAGRPAAPEPEDPWLTVDCEGFETGGVFGTEPYPGREGPRARLLHDSSLALSEPTAVGFHALPPFDDSRLVELTQTPATAPAAIERAQALFAALGRHTELVADAPGLVLGRIVCALINEAAFLIGEGNGTPEDVDAGLTLGVNHPRGPVAWLGAIGHRHVVAVLEALYRELGEDRYRVAPLLRRQLALSRPGRY